MKRFACLRLPRWPIQRLIVAQPKWRGRPILVHRRDHRGQFVVECSSAARKAGVRINMPLNEATALCPIATTAIHDPTADMASLGKLAEYCERFSPLVGWQTATRKTAGVWFGEMPAHLFLDLTGVPALFGGEVNLVERMLAECRRLGYKIALAIADSLGAAWALANESPTIVPPGENITALRPLPIAQLRLPAEDVDILERLGVQVIEQLMRLTRTGLAERLSQQVLLRLDQAIGTASEMIVPHRPAPKYQATFWLEVPSDQRDTIDWLIEKLVERVVDELQTNGEGAVVVTGQFRCEDHSTLKCEVGLFRPSASVRHIVKLLRLQTERLILSAPIVRIRIHAVRTALLEDHQGELFADPSQQVRPERAALLERLSGRLGASAVVGPVHQSDALPEQAYRYVSMVGQKLRSRSKPIKTSPQPFKTAPMICERPLRLLTPPSRIEMTVGDSSLKSFQWHRNRHIIARHWGPERIETGWWRRAGVARRDYFRVETSTGQRFWLYRDLIDGTWYLHGSFE